MCGCCSNRSSSRRLSVGWRVVSSSPAETFGSRRTCWQHGRNVQRQQGWLPRFVTVPMVVVTRRICQLWVVRIDNIRPFWGPRKDRRQSYVVCFSTAKKMQSAYRCSVGIDAQSVVSDQRCPLSFNFFVLRQSMPTQSCVSGAWCVTIRDTTVCFRHTTNR